MGKTVSLMQLEANRKNAEKSTGPRTTEGREVVARNALKHGLFSRYLLLDDEDPAEYQALLHDLHAELKPLGTLEYSLVERIAVTLWRQHRLVRSETAALALDHQNRKIAEAVCSELRITAYSNEAVKEDDLTEFDQEQAQWCRSVLAEYEALDPAAFPDPERLKKEAPLIFEQLARDAVDENQLIPDYLDEWDQPQDYFVELACYCRNQLAEAERRPVILALAKMVRSKRAILRAEAREMLSKYQVVLDNELYKALKALREAQEWRMKSIEAVAEVDGFVPEKASA